METNRMNTVLLSKSDELRSGLCDYCRENKDFNFAGVYTSECLMVHDIVNMNIDIVLFELSVIGNPFEFVSKVKNASKRTKLIMFTAITDANMLSYFLKIGISDYITAPYSLDELKEKLTALRLAEQMMSEKNNLSNTNNLVNMITELEMQMGIPKNISGFYYIREAILLLLDFPLISAKLSKDIYPTIAKKNKIAVSSVERGIRYAIDTAWNNNSERLKNTLGYQHSYRPTNVEVIKTVADKYRTIYEM